MLRVEGSANRTESGGGRSAAIPILDATEGREILERRRILAPVSRSDPVRGIRRTADGVRKGMVQFAKIALMGERIRDQVDGDRRVF